MVVSVVQFTDPLVQEGVTVGGLLWADIRASGFNGDLQYEFMNITPDKIKKDEDPQDQMYTAWAEFKNPNVGMYAYGLRNAFGLTVGLKGNVMVSVNAVNIDYGPAMLGYNTTTLEPIYIDDKGIRTKDAMWVNLQEVRY